MRGADDTQQKAVSRNRTYDRCGKDLVFVHGMRALLTELFGAPFCDFFLKYFLIVLFVIYSVIPENANTIIKKNEIVFTGTSQNLFVLFSQNTACPAVALWSVEPTPR